MLIQKICRSTILLLYFSRYAIGAAWYYLGRLEKSKCKQLNGITAEEYLEKARILFEEMDLKWDLEQLEKAENEAGKDQR